MRNTPSGRPAFVGSLLFGAALSLSGQSAVPLGTAASFAVLGATPNVTNTGPTVVTGDLGVSPAASVTGFPPGVVVGAIHLADAVAAQAQLDLGAAITDASGRPCPGGNNLTGQVLGSGGTILTLVPGVYCFASTAQLTGDLVLNGSGIYIFQIGTSLTTASASSVTLTNGASACNVSWIVGSSATIGTTTNFAGSILAVASITANTGAHINGRMLARTATVTMDTNTVSTCAIGPGPGGLPTLSPFALAILAAGLSAAALLALRRP
ncbi:MAG: ice-binding family protein [Acidobacteriota bacterium]